MRRGRTILCLKLFRTENPVARIAESGADVSVFIEAAVQMSYIDLDVGVIPVQPVQTFRCGDDGHKFDVFAAVLLDHGDGIGA